MPIFIILISTLKHAHILKNLTHAVIAPMILFSDGIECHNKLVMKLVKAFNCRGFTSSQVLFVGRTASGDFLIEISPVSFKSIMFENPNMDKLREIGKGNLILSCPGGKGKNKGNNPCNNELCKCFDCTCGEGCTCGKTIEVNCEPCTEFKLSSVNFQDYNFVSRLFELGVGDPGGNNNNNKKDKNGDRDNVHTNDNTPIHTTPYTCLIPYYANVLSMQDREMVAYHLNPRSAISTIRGAEIIGRLIDDGRTVEIGGESVTIFKSTCEFF